MLKTKNEVMRFRGLFLLFCLAFSCSDEKVLLLENAKVVDVKSGKIETFNILIKETGILKISKEKIVTSKRIDLNGKYIIPSLWDMHVHLHGNSDTLKEFFNYGVLGVRDLGAFQEKHIDSLVKWKQELQSNRSKAYPRVIYAGFTHNDTICFNEHTNITTYDELIASVVYLKKIGSSFYKVHNCFPSKLLQPLDSLASKYSFKFGGHLPQDMDPIEYVNTFHNIGSIEHASILVRGLSFREREPLSIEQAIHLLDGSYLDSLASAMAEKQIAFTPNLISEYAFMMSYPMSKKALGEAFFEKLKAYTKRISDHGVLILAGSDAGVQIEAGRSLYNELKLLSEAGLSHTEVLQSATINADIFNSLRLNIIEENTDANFLILNNNPLEILPTPDSVYGFVHNGILRLN